MNSSTSDRGSGNSLVARCRPLPNGLRLRRVQHGVAAAVLAMSAHGCTFRHKMAYDMHDVPLLSGGALSQSAVQVEAFLDERDSSVKARKSTDFGGPPVVMRSNDDWYCTSDDLWETGVADGVTLVVAEHLRAAKLFGAVFTASQGTPPRFVLRGKIARLEACRQRELTSEALVSQMGLIGLAIAATNDVDYDATVMLEDVRLIDTTTQTTIWQGRAEGTVKGVEPIDAYGKTVFLHTKQALRGAVDQLVDQLAKVRVDATRMPEPAAP